jgi:hypothetical protein
MHKKKLQVFISSTYLDMKEERRAVVDTLLELGHLPAGMELFSAGSISQLDVIKRWIDSCDVFMLILGGRYGSIEPTSNLSYIECEYDYALLKNKQLFALIADDIYLDEKVKREGRDVIEKDDSRKYNSFKSKVKDRLVGFFSDIAGLKNETSKSLREFEQNELLVGWVRANDKKRLNIGEVTQYYYPLLDPMKHKIGSSHEPESYEDACKVVLMSNFNNIPDIRWIYGPYRKLPIVGDYCVIFSLKAGNIKNIRLAPNEKIITLDIYDYQEGRGKLAERLLSFHELSNNYQEYSLNFIYPDTRIALEYRIGVHSRNEPLELFSSKIVVKSYDTKAENNS